MKFMMLIKGNQKSEAGILPGEKVLAAMWKYNEDLMKAGVLLDLNGLQASSRGARIRHSKGKVRVVDGPFTEAKELVAGYWTIQVKSKDEAIEWAKRVPTDPDDESGEDFEVEVRQVFELSDFPASAAIEKHAELGEQLARK